MSFLLITTIGLGVGLLLGLTGVGSGSVLTPLLILACGVVPAKAVGLAWRLRLLPRSLRVMRGKDK